MVQGPMLLVILIIAIVFIVYMTARIKLHAFLVLLIAAYGVGLAAKLPAPDIVKTIADGFGTTLRSIGIVIAAGTIIGVILERSGGALRMAETVLKITGLKRSPMAMSIIGYITSVPVFCDSGFVILSSLSKSLAARSKVTMATMAVALSTGLYATHTLVPPTPGPIAAAGNIKADLGLVILFGIIVAIPAAVVGYLWATRYASKFEITPPEGITYEELLAKYERLPSACASFAPIVIPIILITLSSIAAFPSAPFGKGSAKVILEFLGNPITALLIGIFLALRMVPKLTEEVINGWVGHGLKDAAAILIITGAGGSLGAILRATKIGDYLGSSLADFNLGIILPFIIAAAIKTAQGSSTVALITTSVLVAPLLPAMGFTSEVAKALVVMAIGAGSMTVSHANDSYFWVVSQFSGMDVKTALKSQTMATLIQGLTAIIVVFILATILV